MGTSLQRNAWVFILFTVLMLANGFAPAYAGSSVLGAEDNPVPVGKPILMNVGGVQEYVAIAEINRGDSAWQRIHRYSAKNTPPTPGKEYLMAMVVVRYVSGPEKDAVLNFQAISNKGVAKEAPASIVYVRPDFEIDFTPDSMSGGWVVREVDPADPTPLLAVSLGKADTQKIVYFSLTE